LLSARFLAATCWVGVRSKLTDDARYDHVWDCENRLIEIVTKRAGDPQNGDKKVVFVYDYMGRRVRKTASTHNGSTWVEDSDLLFVYDGWNTVLVLDDNNDTQRKYTWGVDLAGLNGGASRNHRSACDPARTITETIDPDTIEPRVRSRGLQTNRFRPDEPRASARAALRSCGCAPNS